MSRFRQALLRWLKSDPDPSGVEALFTDPLLTVSSLDPREVGRQERRGGAILETAAWLEAAGWHDVETGDRQRYAAWLLEQRDAYERQGAPR